MPCRVNLGRWLLFQAGLLAVWAVAVPLRAGETGDDKTLRVFIFAGQSNMVGSDSKVKDIGRFPPFVGLEKAPGSRSVFLLHRTQEQDAVGRLGGTAAGQWSRRSGAELRPGKLPRRSRLRLRSSRSPREGLTWEVTGIPMNRSASRCIRWRWTWSAVRLRNSTSRESRTGSKGSCGTRAKTTCSTRTTCPTMGGT